MAQNQEVVIYEEEFISNPRGLKLFTCRWLPKCQKAKALIFICHGYAVECSITMKGTGTRLAKAGYAVYGIDYEGHGKSSGLQGYVRSFSNLVDDVCIHFKSVCEREENKNMHRFLFGESMGGAVALLLHRKEPDYWDGAVFVAPMCKIADEMKPNPVAIKFLKKLARVVPTWKVIPSKDIINVTIKDPDVQHEFRLNPYCYKGRPRLKTAYELLTVSLDIEKNLNQVSIPFLIVHGEEDSVTDPMTSKLLFELATSKDKAFNLYPGMWHALTSGEPVENIDLVFSDIVGWLDDRSIETGARTEMEQKSKQDVQLSIVNDKVRSEIAQKSNHDVQLSTLEEISTETGTTTEIEQNSKQELQSSILNHKERTETEPKPKHDDKSSTLDERSTETAATMETENMSTQVE